MTYQWLRVGCLAPLATLAMACGGNSKHSGTGGQGGSSASAHGGASGTSGMATGGSGTGGGSVGGSSVGGSSVGGSSAGGSGGDAGAGTGGTSGTGGATGECSAQDVRGVGDCAAVFGVHFLGDSCGWVGGCSCEGSDCEQAYEDELMCELANRGCLEGCAPQDATSVGSCEPVPFYVFNGMECVPMEGCDCVGADCERAYRTGESQASCEQAHEVCQGGPTTCEEIARVHDDFITRNDCTEDFDCVVAGDDCSVGMGGCHQILNRHWSGDVLAALAQAWHAAGCGGPVCDCLPPPESAVCLDGRCVAAP